MEIKKRKMTNPMTSHLFLSEGRGLPQPSWCHSVLDVIFSYCPVYRESHDLNGQRVKGRVPLFPRELQTLLLKLPWEFWTLDFNYGLILRNVT